MKLSRLAVVVALFFLLLALFSPLAGVLATSLDAVIDTIAPLLRLEIPTTKYVRVNGTLREVQEVAVVDITPVIKAIVRVLVLLLPLVALFLLLRVKL